MEELLANAAARRGKDKGGYDAGLKKIEEEIREVLGEAEQEDTREDKLYGEARGDEPPKVPRAKEAFEEKIQEGVKGWKGEEKEKVNLTDRDIVL